MPSCGVISGIITGVIALFLLIGLLVGFSVFDVQNDEISLIYNTVTKEFDRNQVPLEQGRHYLSPGMKLYTFQRISVLESFEYDNSISCLTNDGLQATVEVTFQHTVIPNDLVTLFLTLSDDFQDVLIRQAQAAIYNACGNFSATEFYYLRSTVQNSMSVRADTALAEIYLSGGLLQLINIQFDPQFSSKYSKNLSFEQLGRVKICHALK